MATFSKNIYVAPALGQANYSAGRIMGGLLTLSDNTSTVGFLRHPSFSAVLQNVAILLYGTQTPPDLRLVMMGKPDGGVTDNATYTLPAGATANAPQGMVTVTADTWVSHGTSKIAVVRNIGLVVSNVELPTAPRLHACLISLGAFSGLSSNSIALNFGFLVDG